jgi:crotonobetainyl-CoA:carnitine CoA-transferase CaiB-like acyl-CoA transferase
MGELLGYVEAWFAARTYEEAERELETHQVPYSRLMSMADIFAEPHYRQRQMIIDVPDDTLGTIPQPGVVPKLSRTPGRVKHAGPPLGQDTDAVLAELLGLSAAQIATLRQEGVV